MAKKALVIGSGFAGLSASAYLAQAGFEVEVLEKNSSPGGRARKFEHEGFVFDMGPSWYWMPDVFEQFFAAFGKKAEDYYELKRLDPSYQVFFGQNEVVKLPGSEAGVIELFEEIEPGAGDKLRKFLKEAAYKYEVGINDLVHKPGQSLLEFMDWRVISGVFRLHLFKSFSKYVKQYFKDPRLVQLMEFPVLFLGAKPEDTPALYSLMNYADISLGTWYPMGGMHKIVEGMMSVCLDQGVKFNFNQPVDRIRVDAGRAREVGVNGTSFHPDVVVGGADYHHIERTLLSPDWRQYSETYWDKRVMAPSSLIFYVGLNKKLIGLEHHNLFFDTEFGKHASEIYDQPKWPSDPLFYVSCPSQTDDSVAPEGHENLFILIPVAPGLDDDPAKREPYFDIVMDRMEKLTGQEIKKHVVYKRSYAHQDFISDYNAFKGNAYGLANTLRQTAILKPSIRSKKVNNLFYTGQLTVPGPGVPPSLISGKVVAELISKELKI